MYVWAYLYVVLGFRCWVPTHFEITHQMPYSISKPTLISVFFAVGSSHIRYLFFVRPSPALNPTSDNYICSRLCCSTVWENILRLTKKSMGWKSQTAQAYKFPLMSDVGFGLDRAFHEFVCIFFQRNPKSKWRTYREQHSSQKRNIVLNWFILCAFETCVCTSATLSGLCLLSVYQDVSRNKWVSRVCYVIKQMTIMLRTKIQDNRIKSQKLRGKKGNYAFLELLLLFLFVMRYSSSSDSKLHILPSFVLRASSCLTFHAFRFCWGMSELVRRFTSAAIKHKILLADLLFGCSFLAQASNTAFPNGNSCVLCAPYCAWVCLMPMYLCTLFVLFLSLGYAFWFSTVWPGNIRLPYIHTYI